MLDLLRKRYLFWLCILSLGIHLAIAPQVNAKSPAKSQEDQKAADGAKKTLEKALDQAVTEGKTTVNVVVDDDPKLVQHGDLVDVQYTATDEEGRLVRTTLATVANDAGRKKAPWYDEGAALLPEQVVAGQPSGPLSLGYAILDMHIGEKKSITIPPDKAFGAPDPRKQMQIPCVKTMPKVVRLSAEEYTSRFKSFPKVGQEVSLVPYFKARTTEITDTDVALEFLAKDGEKVEEPFGTAETRVDEREVRITLTPHLGASFAVQEGRGGVITATDGTVFTVDSNHPLAGKNVSVELEIVSLVKASSFRNIEISWIEDHEKGIQTARAQGKPVVLVLYADWCDWCKRLFNETIQDPRLKVLRNEYVWIKVNSDKEQNYKQLYGQEGFPMIVLLDSEGKIVKKIDGFRDAGSLRAELNQISGRRHAAL